MNRRSFMKGSVVAAAVTSNAKAFTTTQPVDNRKVSDITFPQKRPLITYSDRPPLLESPRDVFDAPITPNDQFFVRWHMPEIPTHIDLKTYKIKVNGAVEKELSYTIDELKNDFEQVEVTAVLQCGGNSRSAFHPTPGGIQWGSGAMGSAKWKGVRFKDLLDKAGLKKDAAWIGFNGLDNAAYYETPNFVRELHIDEISDHTIIAYEMNGEELPYLNGFPCRLVIPGYYSDSWVKMLSNITVTTDYQKLFFMDKAYRVPDNKCECQEPGEHVKTKPITEMNVKSVIGYPTNNSTIMHNTYITIRGVAFDQGKGIKNVVISTDGGKSWSEAQLGEDYGRYAFRPFRFYFKPTQYGKVTIMCKAINKLGQEQPFAKDIGWNHGGYKFNGIDVVTVEVI